MYDTITPGFAGNDGMVRQIAENTEQALIRAEFDDARGFTDEFLAAESWRDGVPEGSAVVPSMSGTANEVVRNGMAHFRLETALRGHFGADDAHGASNVTFEVVDRGMTQIDVIGALADQGQIAKALVVANTMRESGDPPAVWIVALALMKFGVGWAAERALAEFDGFSKGSASQDEGGIDGWLHGEPVQIKPVTEVGSQGPEALKNKEYRHILYIWSGDTLHFADVEDYGRMMDAVAEESGLYKSVLYTGSDLAAYGYDREIRFLWW